LHNEEFHNLHASPNIITMMKLRKMTWVGHVERMGENEKCIHSFGLKTSDNIKMYLREVGSENVEWIHMAQVGASGKLL
jgi:hypothetical protein